jgi:hypothetical protein
MPAQNTGRFEQRKVEANVEQQSKVGEKCALKNFLQGVDAPLASPAREEEFELSPLRLLRGVIPKLTAI